ncbi:nucleotidyltransferase family protein [Rhodococcus sp. NPDC060086]|uniref:nucleotidyltransferase family protein n=1 Tax=Rhodococcus sp. NPDC060086 TaxID=3347055 RepID=UPI00365E3FF2
MTPTVDGDVLAVLAATADNPFTTGQLHRMLSHYSEAGIRKVLQRLSKQGTVLASKIGNAYVYRLNPDHLGYEHIVGLAGIFNEFLRRVERELSTWPAAPVYAAIFGSAARGTMTVDSDIDIFLVRSDTAPVDDWDGQVTDLLSAITKWTGNDARDLQFTESEITRHRNDEPVLDDIASEGVTVAGSRSHFIRTLRRESA